MYVQQEPEDDERWWGDSSLVRLASTDSKRVCVVSWTGLIFLIVKSSSSGSLPTSYEDLPIATRYISHPTNQQRIVSVSVCGFFSKRINIFDCRMQTQVLVDPFPTYKLRVRGCLRACDIPSTNPIPAPNPKMYILYPIPPPLPPPTPSLCGTNKRRSAGT